MARLAPVLSERDLPLAELHAARLDGDVFAIGEGFASIDELEYSRHRALSLKSISGERLIAERSTAAWIHGATPAPPSLYEFCIPYASRTGPVVSARYRVREVVIEADEILAIDGVLVTTPIRTVLDLLRQEECSDTEARAVRALIDNHGVSPDDCQRYLQSRYKLSHKLIALERLEALARLSS